MPFINSIIPGSKNITKIKQRQLQSFINEYDKRYKSTFDDNYPKFRNKIGLYGHFGAFLLTCATLLVQQLSTFSLLLIALAKLNYDFTMRVSNIDKLKSAGLSRFLKNEKNVTNNNELQYAISKYFIKNGAFLYPFMHPQKTKKIAINNDPILHKEFGCFFACKPGKSLITKFIRLFEKKPVNMQID